MCVFKFVLSSCVCWAGRERLYMCLLMTQLFFFFFLMVALKGIQLCVLMCIDRVALVSTALQTQTGTGSDETGAAVQGNGSGDPTGVS